MYNPRRPDQALIGTVKGGVAVVSPQERKTPPFDGGWVRRRFSAED
jgi:hypothetical protein